MIHETVQMQIKHIELRIEQLLDSLPYADGQSYYDDKRKIEQLTIEACRLKQSLAAVDGEG